ncbi:GNAT family N-acetyltransferase [Microlunatus endophyticus]|nr:GNAT family N-acetyltransferase [Microlunatus endophyticus]
MYELQRVRADHQASLLAFELENRGYFAQSISDRGDEYFDHFALRHDELLADQDAGLVASYVLVDETGAILGRFNLYRIRDGAAEVGYRIAEQSAGRGLTTAAVRKLCRLAASRHGLHTLRAATSDQNFASQRVLLKAGFVPGEVADPADIGGKQGHWYHRDLTARTDIAATTPVAGTGEQSSEFSAGSPRALRR